MINIENACCFTGYRPEKFDFAFDTDCRKMTEFDNRLLYCISQLIEQGCTVFYCGMAKGFDIVAGECVALLKQRNKKIRLIAVEPFAGNSESFDPKWKQCHDNLLTQCDEVVTLNLEYSSWCYSQRNRYMVDRSRYVVTYYDGRPGGTQNTLNYATKHSREIINIYNTNPIPREKFHRDSPYRFFLVKPD